MASRIQKILDSCYAKLESNIRIEIQNDIQEFTPITFSLKEITQQKIYDITEIIQSNLDKLSREDFEYKGKKFYGGYIIELFNNEYNDFFIKIDYSYTDVKDLHLVGGNKSRGIIHRQSGNMYVSEPEPFWNGYMEYSFEEPLLVHLQV